MPYRETPSGAPKSGEGFPLARLLFYTGWCFALPLMIALGREFLLVLLPRAAWVDTVRGQPIPVAIILFTVSAMDGTTRAAISP